MVLPVPDRPKNRATSSFAFMLALQCMGSTPSAGSFQFMTVKIDFLISPAYSVPAMTISFWSKESAIAVDVRTPSRAGSAW